MSEYRGIVHELKCESMFFADVVSGVKTFEVRKNDRDFRQGQRILLRESKNGVCLGQACLLEITYMLFGGQYGIDPDYVVMGIKVLNKCWNHNWTYSTFSQNEMSIGL